MIGTTLGLLLVAFGAGVVFGAVWLQVAAAGSALVLVRNRNVRPPQ